MTSKNKKEPRKSPSVGAISDFRLELDRGEGGVRVLINGARAIRDFSPTRALVRVKGATVLVAGDGLQITVYEGRAVELVGKISGVELLNDKT